MDWSILISAVDKYLLKDCLTVRMGGKGKVKVNFTRTTPTVIFLHSIFWAGWWGI
jgi:hypothetical protein